MSTLTWRCEAGSEFQPLHCLSVGMAVQHQGPQFLPRKQGLGVPRLPVFLDYRWDEGKVELQLRAWGCACA